MTTITIEQAGKYDGQSHAEGVALQPAESGNCCFDFSDARELFRAFCAEGKSGGVRIAEGLTQESSVIVTGKIRAEKRAPGGLKSASQKFKSSKRFGEHIRSPFN